MINDKEPRVADILGRAEGYLQDSLANLLARGEPMVNNEATRTLLAWFITTELQKYEEQENIVDLLVGRDYSISVVADNPCEVEIQYNLIDTGENEMKSFYVECNTNEEAMQVVRLAIKAGATVGDVPEKFTVGAMSSARTYSVSEYGLWGVDGGGETYCHYDVESFDYCNATGVRLEDLPEFLGVKEDEVKATTWDGKSRAEMTDDELKDFLLHLYKGGKVYTKPLGLENDYAQQSDLTKELKELFDHFNTTTHYFKDDPALLGEIERVEENIAELQKRLKELKGEL